MRRTTLKMLGVGLLAATAMGGAAEAQHAHSHAAPNGGQIQQIGAYEAELTVKGSDMTLYLTDDKERKVEASKFSASAVVLAKGNQQRTVEMAPSGDNKLAGKADFPVDGKFRATITLKTAGAEAGKGRYTVDVAR